MAFKSRWSKRASGARPLSRARAFRAFSRKKLNWVTAYNQVCDFEGSSFAPCVDGVPDGPLLIPLLTSNAGQIAGGYNFDTGDGDSVICRRVQGKLSFAFTPDNVDNFAGFIFRMGLKVVEGSWQDATILSFNPLYGESGESGDYADGRWLKMWDVHKFIAADRTQLPPQVVWKPQIVDCVGGLTECITRQALTGGDGFTWQYVYGNGIQLGGSCETCDEVGSQTSVTQKNIAPVVTIPVRYGRPVRLRENQNLVLFVGCSGLSATVQPTMSVGVVGGVRCLLEK